MRGICSSRATRVAAGALLALVGGWKGTADCRLGAAEPTAAQQSLFNGRDLSGWQAEGGAVWEVHDGLLVGRQGPDNQPGDLLTTAEFADFELSVVCRMVWPGNSGVWYRYQSAERAYQADILEYQDPIAYTGSLYCTGKMFLACNTDPKLVRREEWNTIVIRAVGDRHTIELNGTFYSLKTPKAFANWQAQVPEDLAHHGGILERGE